MSQPFRVLDAAIRLQEFAGQCALTVMAKAPVPGKVKTRLSPPLTPLQAAELNADFLRDTLASLGDAAQASRARCVVSYTPVGQEAAFTGILPESTLLLPQRGDGFGERLLTTAADLFACGFNAVCLIDSDSPTVPTSEFVRAVKALLPVPGQVEDCAVLGRSTDGGYYLLGLTRPHAQLFEAISWSTELVGDETAERARELGLLVVELRTWYDVDDAASLDRLRREMAGERGVPAGYAAPNTRAFLLGLQTAQPAPVQAGAVAHGAR